MSQYRKLSVVALLAAAVGFGCAQSPPPVDIQFRTPVQVETVEAGDVESVIVATGNLQTRESVTVTSQVPGRLYIGLDENGRRYEEGHKVQAGDIIAQITGEETRLHVALEQSLTNLANAETELTSFTRLHKQGMVSDSELRGKDTAFKAAKLEYERQVLQDANTQLEAPIDGIILKLARDQQQIPIADGQLISTGVLIAQIASLDVLEAYIDLIGPELSRIEIGQEVRVKHYAFKEMSITGEVTRLSPTVDPQTNTIRAVIEVNNEGMLLRPGMFVQVEIITEQRIQVPVVDYESISRRGGRSVVFVLDGQRVRQQEVRLGLGDDEKQEVLEGVKLGDKVVVRGLETLVDRALVRVLGE